MPCAPGCPLGAQPPPPQQPATALARRQAQPKQPQLAEARLKMLASAGPTWLNWKRNPASAARLGSTRWPSSTTLAPAPSSVCPPAPGLRWRSPGKLARERTRTAQRASQAVAPGFPGQQDSAAAAQCTAGNTVRPSGMHAPLLPLSAQCECDAAGLASLRGCAACALEQRGKRRQ